MTGLITVGESLGLIRGDGIGGLEHLSAARVDTGGAEGNVAIGVARLGGSTTWLTPVRRSNRPSTVVVESPPRSVRKSTRRKATRRESTPSPSPRMASRVRSSVTISPLSNSQSTSVKPTSVRRTAFGFHGMQSAETKHG